MKLLFKKILIVVIYCLPIILLGYLFWQNTKSDLDLQYIPGKPSAMAPDIVPLARLGETRWDIDGRYKIINQEPVYLDVSLPRKYDRVDVEVEYFDLDVPVFELGVSRDEQRKNFDFIPLENKILDNLLWNKIEEGGLILYQRNKKYNSINEFLSSPPTFKDIVLYRADLEPRIVERWQQGESIIDFPVKKSIQMMVYHLGGELKVQANVNEDYAMNVFYKGEAIEDWSNLNKGIYKIDLHGSNDLVFNQIKINSPYLAILNSINIGKLAKPLKIYSATSRLLFKTESAEGLQTLKIDNRPLVIDEGFKQYGENFDNRGLKQIVLEKGNLQIEGSLIFLSDKNLFYPIYEKFYSNINLNNVNFILTSYSQKNTASFDISNTPTPYNKLRFLLSLPNGNSGLVNIRSIKFKFTGEEYLLKNIFNKITNKLMKLIS